MLQIGEGQEVFTVIVTVDAAMSAMAALEEHAAFGVRHFATYPGYLSGALHVSTDGTRLIQYLQWESESTYRACIDDPAWDQLESARLFKESVASGLAKVDARSFRVAASCTVRS